MSNPIMYTNTLALFSLHVMLCNEQSKCPKHWDNCLSHCIYGTKPIALPKVIHRTNAPIAEGCLIMLKIAREEALAAHDLARQKMMQRTMCYSKPFKLGQKVWLESKNLRIPYPSRKLAPKREVPFLIKQVMAPVTYSLTLLKQCKIQ